MEVQMAAQDSKSTGRGSTRSDSHRSGGAIAIAKPVPGYLRPSAGSCHHVCKYGGTHTFEADHKAAHRPQPRPPPPESHNHSSSRVLVKVRSVFRRRVGDSSTTATQKPSKTAAGTKAKTAKSSGGESVEWKDIVAYDMVPTPHGSSSPGSQLGKASAHQAAKKKDVMKGKKSYGKPAKIHEQVKSVEGRQNEPLDNNARTDDSTNKSLKPTKAKKPMVALLVENMGGIDQETLQGYQILSPSLAQSRANLLRDLEKEMMVQEPANVKEQAESTTVAYSLNPEEYAAAVESRRPIPAHRRVQSMSMMSMSSRSVRHPFGRQASKNSGTFKLRSRSTRAPVLLLPPQEEKQPARLRSRRGDVDASSASSTGRGIHLRIRSLRRRGVGGSGGVGTGGGFVVPVVALRHQKTLEKKKSQRLYNNLIEETATKLVKTRKSRVKALVGAFESVISKIAK